MKLNEIFLFIYRFPTHTAPPNATRTQKENLVHDLRNKLSKDVIKGTSSFYVTLPFMEKHSHTPLGAARRMHPMIRSKIVELVEDGITNSKVIKKLLRKFVKRISKEDYVSPHPTDRAFYPLEKDIINAVHAAVSFGKYSVLDQINLEKLVCQWTDENEGKPIFQQKHLYFRKCSTEEGDGVKIELPKSNTDLFGDEFDESADEQPDTDDSEEDSSIGSAFLFVHQEGWQQQLLVKYGNTMTLLDATYKTTKYTLPLFLLCVRTNNGYIPVAEFIVERETETSIAEALQIISNWNKEWKPPCFMVDYSTAELNGILAVFPRADVYLCEFHREQAWTRWIRNGTVIHVCNF